MNKRAFDYATDAKGIATGIGCITSQLPRSSEYTSAVRWGKSRVAKQPNTNTSYNTFTTA